VVLVLLLKNPEVQTLASKFVASFLSDRLEAEITVGKIGVGFPGTFTLRDLSVMDQHGKTLAMIKKTDLALKGINRFKRTISFSFLKMQGVNFSLRHYAGEEVGNLQKMLSYFQSGSRDTTSDASAGSPWKLRFDDLVIRNASFMYEDQELKSKTDAIDYNDIQLDDLDLIASQVRIDGDTIYARFKNLSFVEKSGLELKEFSGKIKFSPTLLKADQLIIQTNNSALDLDLFFEYNGLEAYHDFINHVRFEGDFRKSTLDMSDIGFFAETMFTMKDTINFDGKVTGTVANIYGKDMHITYGEHTRFAGQVRMNGLPDFNAAFIHADIDELQTTAADVGRFALPDSIGSIAVPDLLYKTNVVNVKGKFTGFPGDFVAKASFKSNIGQLNTDISLKTRKSDQRLSYKGELVASRLDLGRLLGKETKLGKSSFAMTVDGHGISLDDLDVSAKGWINSLVFNDYKYQNIKLDGSFKDMIFEGHTKIEDQNLDFTFNGLIDFKKQIPRFDFTSAIHHANLNALHLSNRDSTGILSTRMKLDFYATSIDDIQGTASFDSLTFKEAGQSYTLDTLVLKSEQYADGRSGVLLNSDYVDLTISGKYTLSQMLPSIKKYLQNYSANLAEKIPASSRNDSDQHIQFALALKNTDALSRLFVPALQLSRNSTISGDIDLSKNSAIISAQADTINLAGLQIYDWHLATSSSEQQFESSIRFGKILPGEEVQGDGYDVGIDSLFVQSQVSNDTLSYQLSWNDLSNAHKNFGKISGFVQIGQEQYYSAGITDAAMYFDSTRWSVAAGNKLVADTSGLFFDGLDFISDSAQLSISGGISKSPLDSLSLGFEHLNISHLDQLIPGGQYDIDGVVDGGLTMVNLYTKPNFLADIRVSDLYFNREELGLLLLNTSWENDSSRLDVQLDVLRRENIGKAEVIKMEGSYFPNDEARNFDIDLKLQDLGSQIFNPFIDEYVHIDPASRVSGALKFSGTYDKPVLAGDVQVDETRVLVKYLNTIYSAAGQVIFDENIINVNQLQIFDTLQNQADCSGSISHDYFKDFTLDIQIENDNLLALDTRPYDNELFYGIAYASGFVDISGPLEDITMEIRATTEAGTEISIPISTDVSLAENDYILFINSSDTIKENQQNYNLNVNGFTINMTLDVTPDASINLYLPYGMGDINAKGYGNIGLGVNSRGDFTINGDYEISEGTFNFSFEKLLKREFNINQGSKISWTGDPYDATVNITATLPVTATLAGLRLQTDSTAIRNKKVNVDCNIHLQNSLFNPDISFSLDLKNVAEDTRQIIFAALDTTDQSAMSQQIISLILIKSFSYTTAGPNLGASGFKLLSNQLSNWLSNMSKDFDIGINYQPGTELTEDELEVALKTQLFDDRLMIDGNFGVKGNSQDQNTSNVVGNINVEYQITDDGRFRIKAFNRANDISFLEDNAPYTQGVGIFYRKEFEKFWDLFKKDKSKKQNKKRDKSELKRNDSAVRNDEEASTKE